MKSVHHKLMAGRDFIPPPHARHMFPGPGMVHMPLPPLEIMEERIAIQNGEIHMLITENQRLDATNMAIREEIVGIQNEVHRIRSSVGNLESDKEQQARALKEKNSKMESELKESEQLKIQLKQARADAQSLGAIKQDLASQVQRYTIEIQRAKAEIQQAPLMHNELDRLRQEMHHVRATYDYQKSLNGELTQQMQAMDRNIVSMGSEIEKIRTELASQEKRSHVGSLAPSYKDSDARLQLRGANLYGDGYEISQVASMGAGTVPGRGAYEAPRGVGSEVPLSALNNAGVASRMGGYDVLRHSSSQYQK